MPIASNQTTLRDIASAAGVSTAAVSLALRNSPQISLKVRAKIRKIAQKLHYTPNPLLSAYQSSVRSKKAPKFRAVLGWINDWPDQDVWSLPWMMPLFKGAQENAASLGFQLDQIWIPDLKIEDPEDNARRITRVLRARGIYGIVLPSLHRTHHALLPWEGQTVVCLGRHHTAMEVTTKPLKALHEHHCVNTNYHYNMHLAFARLKAAGCRRLGAIISSHMELDSDQTYSSAFLRGSMDMPAKDRIPILYSTDTKEIGRWVRKYRPDAVICGHNETKQQLEEAGMKIPGDLRLAHLNLAADVKGWSGIDRRLHFLGSAAIDMVSAHLIRNENGVPPYSKEVLIEGVWVEAQT